MSAIDYTNLQRAIVKHMADNVTAEVDIGQPMVFTPEDQPYWYALEVQSVTDNPSREYPRNGNITVRVMCRVALRSNVYAITTFASEVTEHLNRAYIPVYDYEANAESGVSVGSIQMREPTMSRPTVGETWQEITVTVQGRWQMDRGSTLQTLPLS